MFYAYVEKSTGNSGIYWASTSLEQVKEDALPFFENMKTLMKARLIKGIPCIRFYKDEQLIAQWGSW